MKRRSADVYKSYKFLSKGKTVQEMRDLLFVALWEALFLTSCENWSEQGVANTSPADAYELGWWFKRGQDIAQQPLLKGICVEALDVLSLLLNILQ